MKEKQHLWLATVCTVTLKVLSLCPTKCSRTVPTTSRTKNGVPTGGKIFQLNKCSQLTVAPNVDPEVFAKEPGTWYFG